MNSPNESLGELVHIDRKKKGKIRVENGPFFVRLTYSSRLTKKSSFISTYIGKLRILSTEVHSPVSEETELESRTRDNTFLISHFSYMISI